MNICLVNLPTSTDCLLIALLAWSSTAVSECLPLTMLLTDLVITWKFQRVKIVSTKAIVRKLIALSLTCSLHQLSRFTCTSIYWQNMKYYKSISLWLYKWIFNENFFLMCQLILNKCWMECESLHIKELRNFEWLLELWRGLPVESKRFSKFLDFFWPRYKFTAHGAVFIHHVKPLIKYPAWSRVGFVRLSSLFLVPEK